MTMQWFWNANEMWNKSAQAKIEKRDKLKAILVQSMKRFSWMFVFIAREQSTK